jgi:hypothetical protein
MTNKIFLVDFVFKQLFDAILKIHELIKVKAFLLRCSHYRKAPGRWRRAVQDSGPTLILIREGRPGRDRGGRHQTMSRIHGRLDQSQAGASRPRAAPPATTAAAGKPGLGVAICGHRGAGRRARNTACPKEGLGRRAPRRPLGTEVTLGGQDVPPLRLEHSAVPLRGSSSWGREARRRPAAGGSDIRATEQATVTAPRSSPGPLRTHGSPRLGSATKREGALGACEPSGWGWGRCR